MGAPDPKSKKPEASSFELVGVLAASDAYGRLRLWLVDRLEARGGAYDASWQALRAAAPPGRGHTVPYRLGLGDARDDRDDGIRGECWITLPREKAERARIETYAAELRGREVRLTVRPKRYSFTSRAAHNHGAAVAGTSLAFAGGLEPLDPGPRRLSRFEA